MNDREFDALLESAAPELPPDDVARDVTPWRRAIGNILGGSAMCSITLNFFCLNYLLPAIGVILSESMRYLTTGKWWLALFPGLALVLVVALLVELLNSAIENVVDRISPELHPLSKKAKDMGSAAQFTAQICILVVWGTYLIGRFF